MVPRRVGCTATMSSGVGLLLQPFDASLVKALTNPEILIGTFGYLLLAPLLKRTPLVDKRKGAYRRSMVTYNVLMALYSWKLARAGFSANNRPR